MGKMDDSGTSQQVKLFEKWHDSYQSKSQNYSSVHIKAKGQEGKWSYLLI